MSTSIEHAKLMNSHLSAAFRAMKDMPTAYQVGFAKGWGGEPEPEFGGEMGYISNPRAEITGYNDGISAYEQARNASSI